MRKVDFPAFPPKSHTPWWHWLLILGLACLCVAILTPLVIQPLLGTRQSPTAAASLEAWPSPPPVYVPPVTEPATEALATPLSLTAPNWRELNYLTTVEYTASSVVEAQRKANVIWLGEMVTDRLLIEAVGQVQIGIDLSRVRDVRIEGRRIEFVLPKPEVTSVELLPQRSQIYDREQIAFLSQYAGLETEALEQARQQLHEAAAANTSMMQVAEDVARLKLTDFLRKVGFNSVDMSFVTDWTDED